MAIIHIDGFESYGPSTTNALYTTFAHRYPQFDVTYNWDSEIQPGRVDGLCLAWNEAVGKFLCVPWKNTANIILGVAIRPGGDDGWFISIRRWGFVAMQFGMAADRRAWFYTPTIGYTYSDKVLHQSKWYYLEMRVKVHNTAGEVEAWLDGEQVYIHTNVDTDDGNGYVDNVFIQARGGPGGWMLDDFYIIDQDQGGVTTRIGPQCKIETVWPNADTTDADWTLSTGVDHYALVDDAKIDTTDYIYSSTTNDLDLWDYENLSAITTIKAIQVHTAAAITGSQVRQIGIQCKSSTTTSELGVQYVYEPATTHASDTWHVLHHEESAFITENDPHTSSAWTVTNFNAAKFGVKLKA